MAKGDYLGEFEYMVMLSLIRLGKEAYGMVVREDIEKNIGRSISIGSVYAALDRLEAKSICSFTRVKWTDRLSSISVASTKRLSS